MSLKQLKSATEAPALDTSDSYAPFVKTAKPLETDDSIALRPQGYPQFFAIETWTDIPDEYRQEVIRRSSFLFLTGKNPETEIQSILLQIKTESHNSEIPFLWNDIHILEDMWIGISRIPPLFSPVSSLRLSASIFYTLREALSEGHQTPPETIKELLKMNGLHDHLIEKIQPIANSISQLPLHDHDKEIEIPHQEIVNLENDKNNNDEDESWMHL